jgi:RND family efflux transporter MFP subunit
MPDKNPDDSPGADPARDRMLRHYRPAGLARWGIAALAVAGIVAMAGIGWRYYRGVETRDWTEAQTVPTVQLVHMGAAKNGGTLMLPGQLQAFTNAPIHAQVTGYVKKWYVDIGAPVKKGQLLAELDTPDLDGQVQQGRANLANVVAAQKLSAATAKRWNALFAQGAVSRQDKDEKDADLAAKDAAVAAARANLYSLQAQEGFKRLVAPFDGIVTSRTVDVGALVTTGTTTPALFTVSDQRRLRLYVNVPENYAAAIRPGLKARFAVPQAPGRTFVADLVASAGAVNQASGTTLVQFGVDNADGALQPGGYAQVTLPLPAGINGVRLPATALTFRDQGMVVATVNGEGRVHLKPINIVRDLGQAVDATGVSDSDHIIDNPSDSLSEGDKVLVATAK